MFQELNSTLPGALDYSTRNWPANVAVREDVHALTYEKLGQNVSRLAQTLSKHGVNSGDHVAYLMPVGREWVEVFFGALKLGAIVVPLNLTWTPSELLEGLRLTDAKFLIVGSEHRGRSLVETVAQARRLDGEGVAETLPGQLERVLTVDDTNDAHPWALPLHSPPESAKNEPTRAPRPSDAAMILLTSGSTSFPKPAIHTHASMMAGIVSYADGLEVTQSDTFVHTTPSYHVGGITTLVAPLIRGGSVRLTDWFEPERTMRLIEEDRASLIWGFETHFNALKDHPSYGSYDLSTITRTMVAANPASAKRVAAMGFSHVGSIYGSTEYMGSQSFLPYRDRYDWQRMIESNGRPLTAEIRISDPDSQRVCDAFEMGEICVRGPALFSGYYGMEEETRRSVDGDGFFHSGDMGFVDDAGYVYYRGRYKEVIKTGGENVSASEVEQFVQSLPGIRRVIVVGVPDSRWGEAVVAVVEAESEAVSAAGIREACRGHLAGYKIPKEIVFVGSHDWHISPTGKIDRKHLTQLSRERLGRSGGAQTGPDTK